MHLLLLTSLAVPLVAGDPPEWGGFRGTRGDGVAATATIPDSLDPEVNLAWRVEVPSGYSSPVVVGERILVTAAKDEQLLTLCLDRATGAEVWRRGVEFDGKRPGANSPAAPSPVTDGERVFVMFHSFGMLAYDLEGQELWRQPLGPFHIPHGLSSSPLVHEGTVVQCVDQDGGSYLVAFDAASGEERWRTERPGVTHSYASPSLYVPEGGAAQVVACGSFDLAGYDLASGERTWWASIGSWQVKSIPTIAGDHLWLNAYSPSSSEFGMPPASGTFADLLKERDKNENGFVDRDEWDHEMLQQAWFVFDLNDDDKLDEDDWAYLCAAAKTSGGLYCVNLKDAKGDVTESHVDWTYDKRRGQSDVTSPLNLDGVVYLVKSGGILSAFDAASGEVHEQERVGEDDQYYASPVGANGRVVLASLGGLLSVVEAGADWEALSTVDIGERVWSTPALAGDQVFVRSTKALYCFSGSAESAEAVEASAGDEADDDGGKD